MRSHSLEADGKQVVGRGNAAQAIWLEVAECFDRPDTAAAHVLDDTLYEHSAEATSGELGQDLRGHQQYGISAHRAGRKGHRSRHVLGRRVEDEPGSDAVHVDDLPATAPLQQNAGNPRLFLQQRLTRLDGPRLTDGVKFPEDAAPATGWQIVKVVQGDTRKAARQLAPLLPTATTWTCGCRSS